MPGQTHEVGDGSLRGTQLESGIAPPRSTAGFWGPFRAMVIAGFLVGIPIIGVGSRLAMLLLRVTSPDTVALRAGRGKRRSQVERDTRRRSAPRASATRCKVRAVGLVAPRSIRLMSP